MTAHSEIKDLPVNGFKEKVSEMLYQFQQEDYMCDAIIFGSDGSIPAHKIILMASSEFFREKIIFKENYFCESMFYLHEYSVADIENIIRLFYTGRLIFDRQRIESFTRLCKELRIDDVVKICEEFLMKERLKTAEKGHVSSKRHIRGLYDNISDISSDSEDSEGSKNKEICDSSLISKSAKSLSLLYGLAAKDTVDLQFKETLLMPSKKAVKENELSNQNLLSKDSNLGSVKILANGSLPSINVQKTSNVNAVLQTKDTNVTLIDSSTSRVMSKGDVFEQPNNTHKKEMLSPPCLESYVESTDDSGTSIDNPPHLEQVRETTSLSESSRFEYSSVDQDNSSVGKSPPSPLRFRYRSHTYSKVDEDKMVFQCKPCNINFPSKKALFQHRMTIHRKRTSLKKGYEVKFVKNRKMKLRSKYEKQKKIEKLDLSKALKEDTASDDFSPPNLKGIDIKETVQKKSEFCIEHEKTDSSVNVGKQMHEIRMKEKGQVNLPGQEEKMEDLGTKVLELSEKGMVCNDLNTITCSTIIETKTQDNIELGEFSMGENVEKAQEIKESLKSDTENRSYQDKMTSLGEKGGNVEDGEQNMDMMELPKHKPVSKETDSHGESTTKSNHFISTAENVEREEQNMDIIDKTEKVKNDNEEKDHNYVIKSPEKQPKTKTPNTEKRKGKRKLVVKLSKVTNKANFEKNLKKEKRSKLLERTMFLRNTVTPIQEKLQGELSNITEKQENTVRSSINVEDKNINNADKIQTGRGINDNTLEGGTSKTDGSFTEMTNKMSSQSGNEAKGSENKTQNKGINSELRKKIASIFVETLVSEKPKETEASSEEMNSSERLPVSSGRKSEDCSAQDGGNVLSKSEKPGMNGKNINTANDAKKKTSRKEMSKPQLTQEKILKYSDKKSTCEKFTEDKQLTKKDNKSSKEIKKGDRTNEETMEKSKRKKSSESLIENTTGQDSISLQGVKKDDALDKQSKKSPGHDITAPEKRKNSRNDNLNIHKLDDPLSSKCNKEDKERVRKKNTISNSGSAEKEKKIESSALDFNETRADKTDEYTVNSETGKETSETRMDTGNKQLSVFEFEVQDGDNEENRSQQHKNMNTKEKHKHEAVGEASPSKRTRHDIVDNTVTKKKPVTTKDNKALTRRSFEDAIGMVYDYKSIKKRKNDQRSEPTSIRSAKKETIESKSRLSNSSKEITKYINRSQSDSQSDSSKDKSQKELHICKFCNKGYKSSTELASHMTIHTASNIYTCKFCSKLFDNKQIFQDHVITHAKKGSYFCGICNKVYRKLGSLKLHFKVGCGKKSYQCDSCGKEFTLKENLLAHQVIHTDEVSLRCKICKKQFRTILVLRLHMKVHRQKFECEICGKKFNSKEYLVQHEKHHECHKKKQFNCYICNKWFSGPIKLSLHLEEHRTQSQNVCSSEDSEKDSRNLSNGMDNKIMINEEKHSKYDIKTSGGIMKDLSYLKELQSEKSPRDTCRSNRNICNENLQVEEEELTDVDKEYQKNDCVETSCSDGFDTESLISDEGSKLSYKEYMSDSQDSSKGNLTEDEQKKSCSAKVSEIDEKQTASSLENCPSNRGSFWCYICDFYFNDEESLRSHTLLHTGERPHKCEACGNSFFRRWELTRHLKRCSILRTHKTMYKCDNCSDEFDRKQDLQMHSKVHDISNVVGSKNSVKQFENKSNFENKNNPHGNIVNMVKNSDEFTEQSEKQIEVQEEGKVEKSIKLPKSQSHEKLQDKFEKKDLDRMKNVFVQIQRLDQNML